MITIGHGHISLFADVEIARLERLLSDLKRVKAGEAPTPQDLAEAPLLDDYRLASGRVPCLTGEVTGHPRLGDTTVLTTDLWLYAPSLGWARTLSRYYRLGKPMERPEPEV